MRSIDDIRESLLEIPGARFPISNAPPWFHRLSSGCERTTCGADGPQVIGIEERTIRDLDPDSKFRKRGLDRERKQLFERLDNEVRHVAGTDALAWYVSFHNLDDEWGIYVPMSSVHYLASRLYAGKRVRKARRLEIAFQLLLLHEQFHFIADYAQTQIELALHRPCRASLKERLKARSSSAYLEIEEAVANAFMVRALSRELTAKQLEPIRAFVENQPAGYRDALPYADSGAK